MELLKRYSYLLLEFVQYYQSGLFLLHCLSSIRMNIKNSTYQSACLHVQSHF
ncbi:Uncharacterized protein XB15_03097 [Leptospira santarosai]|nr:Uncharacterized protein XB15_03097 [Leptospira santarosai]